jgi:hypothetical protein
MMADADRALDALYAIPPDLPREDWHEAGRAAIAAGLTVDDLLEWSRPASNFKNESDVRSAFRTIRPDGKTGPGTLFYIAARHGWTPPKNGAHRPHAGPKASSHSREKKSPPPADLAERWRSWAPAPAGFDYLVRKGMAPDGLRTAPAGIVIAGTDCAGWLAVPIWSIATAELQGVQLIAPEGRKLTLPGSRITGGVFVAHQDAPEGRPTAEAFAQGPAYLCEGIATTSTAYRACNRPALATFGKGNLSAAATALRERFASLEIILCPDRGGEAQAAEIARGINGAWCELPESWPANADLNDVEVSEPDGIDLVREILGNVKRPAQRFEIFTLSEMATRPPQRQRIRGILPADGIGAIFGAPGTAKSFLALDLLGAIAEGRAWFGRKVDPCPALYVAIEGIAGIPQRANAYTIRRGNPGLLRILTGALDIRRTEDRVDLIAAAKAEGVTDGILLLDTLNAAAPGMSENDAAEMGEAIAALRHLQAELGGAVLVIHHAGKDSLRGLRGHSSLLAALDVVIEVTRTDTRREWKLAKSKDGADGADCAFRLEVVEVGADGDGEPLTSCVIEPDEGAEAGIKRAAPPGGGNMRLAFDAICAALKDARVFGKASAPPGRPCLELDAAIGAAASALPCDPKRRRERAQQALTALVGRTNLHHAEGWIWLP